MPYWTDGTPKKIIDVVPQLRQGDYDALRHILSLHSKHLQKCERIAEEEHHLSFGRELLRDNESMYDLYMDLVFDNGVCLKNKSVFSYPRLSFDEIQKDL